MSALLSETNSPGRRFLACGPGLCLLGRDVPGRMFARFVAPCA